MSTERARAFFDRLRVTKELAHDSQGKVEISFFGYESDSRELFEIESVRSYTRALRVALPELFFFCRTQPPAFTLKVLAMCQAVPIWIEGKSTPDVTRQITYDQKDLSDFLLRGFEGLNATTAWLSMTEEENKRISFEIIQLFS